jgi:tetratricopeptide (TPR) repeat protein
MQLKFTLPLMLFLSAFIILPNNLMAQREQPGRNTDDRIKTRLPSGDERYRPVKQEPPKVKDPIPVYPIKEKFYPQRPGPIDDLHKQPVIEVIIIEEIYYEPPEPFVPINYNYKLEGIQKYKDGDYLNSLEDLNIAIEEDSTDYELYYYRGLVELKIHFYEEAEEDFTKYLEYFFYEPDGYFQRGLAKFYLNEKEEAKGDFKFAFEMGHKLAGSVLKRFY